MHGTWRVKEATDRDNEFVTLLTDPYKAFDCIYQKVLISKIWNDGISPLPTDMNSSYLSNCTQWTKIKESFSERSNIVRGLPQDSTLFPYNLILT